MRSQVIAGRYSLEREIGRGGAGVVWLGRDDVLGRQVALKRIGLLPGADRTDLARAEREATLSAKLNHPNIVAVYDVAVDEKTGVHWLVMEYVEGSTLAELVRKRRRLSPAEAAPLLAQAADALAAAHRARIVHRDVKPSNILVDREGTVKLTDFGIARTTGDAGITQTGLVTGSPSYLAPEVASGGRADEAADVWGLGATAYHLLAGKPPYDQGDSVLGMLYRIVHEDPPRLPDAGRLSELIDGTLVRDPRQRWSMDRVRTFLDSTPEKPPKRRLLPSPPEALTTRVLEVTSVLRPTPAPPPPPPSLPPRRRRTAAWPLIAAVLALVLLLVGGGLFLMNRDPGSTARTGPTAAGIESFIREYVDAVGDDPAKSWQMLTPKFQTESGGFDKYRAFWEPATNGRVLSISANPDDLTVSYQVRFDNFDNGPGPTVLQLAYEDGHYLIDGESTAGFTPAG